MPAAPHNEQPKKLIVLKALRDVLENGIRTEVDQSYHSLEGGAHIYEGRSVDLGLARPAIVIEADREGEPQPFSCEKERCELPVTLWLVLRVAPGSEEIVDGVARWVHESEWLVADVQRVINSDAGRQLGGTAVWVDKVGSHVYPIGQGDKNAYAQVDLVVCYDRPI